MVPAVVPERDDASGASSRAKAPLWAASLGLALACHLGIGLALLPRALPGGEAGPSDEVPFDLSLVRPEAGRSDPAVPSEQEAEPATASRDEPAASPASVAAEETRPSVEAAPSDPIRNAGMTPIPEAAARPAPAPPGPVERDTRTTTRSERAARAGAQTAPRPTARTPASSRNGPQVPARAAAVAPDAGAASAAWRSQIVGILRGRFTGGSRGGMASVGFSVTRAGQIVGARLAVSSGDPRLDAAALAAFRGGVPPPPPGYVGPLAFNIRLGVR